MILLISDNSKINIELLQISLEKIGLISSVAYIPSMADPSRKYFERIKLFYARLGIHKVSYFDLSEEWCLEHYDQMCSFDLVHLSGGDTLAFQKTLIQRNFKDFATKYLNSGGSIIGVSAGAINLCKTIDVANYYGNTILHSENTGLGFIDFDFFPHYDPRTKNEILKFSTTNSGRIVYACDDFSGISVVNSQTDFIGTVLAFQNGRELNL